MNDGMRGREKSTASKKAGSGDAKSCVALQFVLLSQRCALSRRPSACLSCFVQFRDILISTYGSGTDCLALKDIRFRGPVTGEDSGSQFTIV